MRLEEGPVCVAGNDAIFQSELGLGAHNLARMLAQNQGDGEGVDDRASQLDHAGFAGSMQPGTVIVDCGKNCLQNGMKKGMSGRGDDMPLL